MSSRDFIILAALEPKLLWLSTWTIHNNHLRDHGDGMKVGGHQASSASLATIMAALYFAVKPHASPITTARTEGSPIGRNDSL